ncbi:hypothetical protein B0H14DRAFT_3894999 [Mycena olivaceomarginata]|nr:hypothetical protein B0H14DRAFT_3894999 [Mycena olivaceomarginata]
MVGDLETCGLLLGREIAKGGAAVSRKTCYVVETMLIPKQHATSDMCTMDEAEGASLRHLRSVHVSPAHQYLRIPRNVFLDFLPVLTLHPPPSHAPPR